MRVVCEVAVVALAFLGGSARASRPRGRLFVAFLTVCALRCSSESTPHAPPPAAAVPMVGSAPAPPVPAKSRMPYDEAPPILDAFGTIFQLT